MRVKFHKFSGAREVHIHLYKNNKLCNSDGIVLNEDNRISMDSSPFGGFIHYGEKGEKFENVYIGVEKVEFTNRVIGKYDKKSKHLELWQIVNVYLK